MQGSTTANQEFYPGISLIMPVLNGSHALELTSEGIKSQSYKGNIEFIVVDNYSQDGSVEIIKKHLPNTKIIYNDKEGLAVSYNKGISIARYEIIVLMHHDILLRDPDALTRIVSPLKNRDVVASYPSLFLTEATYEEYDFWHKVMFSTAANKPGRLIPTLSGKFDAFKKEALVTIGLFDDRTFRVAGEDVDMSMKLKEVGKVVKSDVVVEHIHGRNRTGSFKNLIKIEMRWGQTFGVLFRKYFRKIIKNPYQNLGMVFQLVKPIFALLMILSIIWSFFMVLVIVMAVYYRYRALMIKDSRVALVPLINLLLIWVYTLTFLHGFIIGKERI